MTPLTEEEARRVAEVQRRTRAGQRGVRETVRLNVVDVAAVLRALSLAEAERDAAKGEVDRLRSDKEYAAEARDDLRGALDEERRTAECLRISRDAMRAALEATERQRDAARRERDEAKSVQEMTEQCLLDRIENRMDGEEALIAARDEARRAAFDEAVVACPLHGMTVAETIDNLQNPCDRARVEALNEYRDILRALRDRGTR